MKKLSLFALATLTLASCGPKFNVSGDITDVASDTILLTRQYADGNRSMDTIALDKGKFGLNLTDTTISQIYIMAMPSRKPNPDGSMPAFSMSAIAFPYIPGEHISIKGSIDDYTLSGSEFYRDLNKFNESIRGTENETKELIKTIRQTQAEGGSEEEIKELVNKFTGLNEKAAEMRFDYIKSNPNRLVSVYLLSQVPFEDLGEALELIPEENRTGLFANYYNTPKQAYERQMAIEKAKENLGVGKPAPNFTLMDLEGKEFTLSSLKGKYVVLDFWGSWCGWCIKGFPEMKKYYEQYKDRIEFVGIDCGDTEDKWKESVKENKIPWINVYNPKDGNVPELYAVSGYPTKYIIDPEGNIVKEVVGESPEFYETIDELMKK